MRVYEVSWEEAEKRNRRHALVKGRTERDARRKADEYAAQEEGLAPESAVLAEVVTKEVEGVEIEIRKIMADWIRAFCSIANTTRRGYYLTWDRDTLTVNDEQRFNVYEPRETQAGFDYRRNAYYRFVADLANQNYYLIGVSIVVLAVFLLLGLRSRRQMHRRFLKKIRKPKEENHVGG